MHIGLYGLSTHLSATRPIQIAPQRISSLFQLPKGRVQQTIPVRAILRDGLPQLVRDRHLWDLRWCCGGGESGGGGSGGNNLLLGCRGFNNPLLIFSQTVIRCLQFSFVSLGRFEVKG